MRVGVDLGGTKIEIIALDEGGAEVARRRVATPSGDYKKTVGAIVSLVRDIEKEVGQRGSVGIGTPGATSPITGLLKNANSTVLIGENFQSDLSIALNRDVRIANDANCFALSESIDGAAAGAHTVFAVILGTGVGGGIAVDGHILSGANRIAGEWGHIPLPWPRDDERPGPECYCGKRGCIETWLAGPRLSAQYQSCGGNKLSPTQIAQAALGGDTIASAVLDEYEDRLARGLSVVINILDPDAIVLGGGVSNIARLCAGVQPRLAHYVLAGEVQTQLVRAAYGDSSGVRGAAMLWPEGRP
ncbi:MAG: ROK family protein [Candidatus Baltobacteraceae bacterium]